MRARYSAYNKQEVDFLLSSLHPEGDGGADRQSTQAWAASADWHGLEVLNTTGGAEGDELGEVEFVAKYSLKGEPQRHHESATFKRHNGRWMYLDGVQHHAPPVVGPKLRLGRNDACPCDTGRKYKKCCLPQFDSVSATPEQLVRARFSAALVGQGRFLERSLHPDAPQSAFELESEPPRQITLLGTDVQSDNATVRVRVETSVSAAEASSEQRVHHLKKLGERWLWLRHDVAPE